MDEMIANAKLAQDVADPITVLINAGDHRQALVLCVQQYGGVLGRTCMALLGDRAEAEEVAQEVFLAAHRSMEQFRGEGTIKSWLFAIARRKCARRLETRGRRQQKLRLVHDVADAAVGPDESVALARRAAWVRQALEGLKPSERDVVVLRYQSGLAYREIGEACGIDEATARKRVSRALLKMRGLLNNGGQFKDGGDR